MPIPSLTTGIDDILKELFFVFGVSLDRIDQVWDQIGAVLILVLNLRLIRLRFFFKC